MLETNECKTDRQTMINSIVFIISYPPYSGVLWVVPFPMTSSDSFEARSQFEFGAKSCGYARTRVEPYTRVGLPVAHPGVVSRHPPFCLGAFFEKNVF